MSANAGTWFYRQPETDPYMVTERLNGTFWQARAVDYYWRCTEAGAVYKADGFMGDKKLEMEWVPQKWLLVKAPPGTEMKPLTALFSRQVLAMPASLSYEDPDGNLIVEWHRDGGDSRWAEIQGNPRFGKPQRLAKKKA